VGFCISAQPDSEGFIGDVKNAIHFLFISEGAARLVMKEVGWVKEMEQGG
jgi:hypothetical protein